MLDEKRIKIIEKTIPILVNEGEIVKDDLRLLNTKNI